MPTMVRGEDGRELVEKMSDMDALEVARRVHENTGETVTLIPYKLVEDEGWVLDEESARTFPKFVAEEPEAETDDDVEDGADETKTTKNARKRAARAAAE